MFILPFGFSFNICHNLFSFHLSRRSYSAPCPTRQVNMGSMFPTEPWMGFFPLSCSLSAPSFPFLYIVHLHAPIPSSGLSQQPVIRTELLQMQNPRTTLNSQYLLLRGSGDFTYDVSHKPFFLNCYCSNYLHHAVWHITYDTLAYSPRDSSFPCLSISSLLANQGPHERYLL